MAPPVVSIYVTSLTSQPKVRKHIDLLHRALKGLEIPYECYDLVNEPEAKTRWQRAKPPGMVVGLPGYLVGGEWVGTMEDFEDAVETQTLHSFLKQDLDLGEVSQPEPTTIPSSTSIGSTSDVKGSIMKPKTVGEAELERLMREMSDADLDALAGELGVNSDGLGKVGLIVPQDPTVAGQKQEEVFKNASSLDGVEDVDGGGKSVLDIVKDPELDIKDKLEKVVLGDDEEGEVKVPGGLTTSGKEKVD